MSVNELTGKVIGLCIDIHRTLGPGLLESAYHCCLEYELTACGISFVSEVFMPVAYKSLRVENGYRADLIVENTLIVELKSIEKINEMHKSQLLTYLKMSRLKIGLLINFKEPLLKNGIYRFINSAASADTPRPLRDVIESKEHA